MTAPAVLIIEDDEILAQSLMMRLRLEGMVPTHAATCERAVSLLGSHAFDAIISDIRLPDGSGEDVFWAEAARGARTPTFFTTAYGDVEQAVRLVKLGATDYLLKPYDIGVLIDRLKRLTSHGRAPSDDVVALSAAMKKVVGHLDRLRDRPENVLLRGPRDSGRQTLARRLHDGSPRAGSPFVTVDGASLTGGEADRLLFGTRIAPGTIEPGLIDSIGEGTLLITDADAIPADVQSRLMRFIGEQVYRPVGAIEERHFAGRLVATALDARTEPSSDRRLGRDLESRLAVHEIVVPALAERRDDLVPLARSFLERQIADFAPAAAAFSEEAEAAVVAHDWPGNLRELRNRIARAVVTSPGPKITAGDLFPDHDLLDEPSEPTLEAARRDAERAVIEAALAENGGRIVETARSLGISRVTLWSKMKRFGIGKS